MFKGICKTAVIGTVVLGALGGGAFLVAGPGRAKAVIDTVQKRVSNAIDGAVDDPVALRNKLTELEREYPKRIAALRADQAELHEQIHQLEREQAISERVVALADADLARLESVYEKAATASAASNNGRARLAAVAFDDEVYSLRRAETKISQIRNTRSAHLSRAADAEHNLTYLQQQAGRFDELIAEQEAERATFQAQLFQLSGQVDSIERNERLITLLEKRQRTLDHVRSYDVASLDQLTGKLDQIRARQEAELDVLSTERRSTGYEDMARMQLLEERQMIDRVKAILPEGHGYDAEVLVPADR